MKKRPSEPNPVGQLRELRDGYIAEKHGHRKRQLDYMVSAFRSYLKLKDHPGRIKAFYETAQVRQKRRGKRPNLLTEIMVYLAAASSESARKLAWKRARVLEFLDTRGVPPDKMRSKIQKYGGIEKAYRVSTSKLPKAESRNGIIAADSKIQARKNHFQTPTRGLRREVAVNEEAAEQEGVRKSNDSFTTVMARIRYSDLEELKEKPIASKLRLAGLRVNKNECMLRITSVSDHQVEW